MQNPYGWWWWAFFDEYCIGMNMCIIFQVFLIVPRPQRKSWIRKIYRRILVCCPIVFLEAHFNVENICLPLSALWIIWLFEKSHFTPFPPLLGWEVLGLGSCQPREKTTEKKERKRRRKKQTKSKKERMKKENLFYALINIFFPDLAWSVSEKP